MRTRPVTLVPYSDAWEVVQLSEGVVRIYSLEQWSMGWSLMTAGYRDQLDPDDPLNPDAPFNFVTVAILAEAKARVFARRRESGCVAHVHVGGETRPHTQEFIAILSRVYAAHGITVHLRFPVRTTPIWYSSFGIFYEGYESGDNVTASHSPYFKGGWKPMDSDGKQLLMEEAEVVAAVQDIVRTRASIRLAPWQSGGLISQDFDVDEPYVRYQSAVLGGSAIADLHKAIQRGFRCAICPMGGSMKSTSERLFGRLGISTSPGGAIAYFFGEEDAKYHGLGRVGDQDYGVDPGKPEVYRNVGAQEQLGSQRAQLVLLWDPDGDRLGVLSMVDKTAVAHAVETGLEIQHHAATDMHFVAFSPNQLFLMLAAYRIEELRRTGELVNYDWFIACSISTSRALAEIAAIEKIPLALVRVGFKYMGTLVEWAEGRGGLAQPFLTFTGPTNFPSRRPRALILCEESGGAIFGGPELLTNRSMKRQIIALREKDAMQMGLMVLSLAAKLYNSDRSLVAFYGEVLKRYNIRHQYFNRLDVVLYDESLRGEERDHAQGLGAERRDRIMRMFAEWHDRFCSGLGPELLGNEINARLAPGHAPLPPPCSFSSVGDGTLITFEDFWVLVRASGTDAVVRYYIEGPDRERTLAYQDSFATMQI